MFLVVIFLVSFVCAPVVTRPERSTDSNNSSENVNFRKKNFDEYFTAEWRNIYSDEALSTQPKWRLIEGMTEQSDYQIREYVNAQWADTTACFNESVATSFRERMHTRFLENGQSNSGLIFPLMIKVQANGAALPVFGLKKDEIENCRYSFEFYYPLYGARDSLAISVQYEARSVRFVYQYSGNFTMAHCNEQASHLKQLLNRDVINFDPNTWRCAQYEPGRDRVVRYEVWFQKFAE